MRREKGFRDILGKEETKMINSKISKIIYIIILLMVVMLIIPNNISKAAKTVTINCNEANFYNCVKGLFKEADIINTDDTNYDLTVTKSAIEKITEIKFGRQRHKRYIWNTTIYELDLFRIG